MQMMHYILFILYNTLCVIYCVLCTVYYALCIRYPAKIPPGDHVIRMHTIPGNSACADCTAPDPEWACIDHGTTICIDCSGVHRSMGVNVSKVRSLLLDNWTEDIILVSEWVMGANS